MHVSYRRAEGLFVNRRRELSASKKHHCAAGLLTVPLISPACQRPKVVLPPYLPLQMDLFFHEFMKSPESTWETFGRLFGPPGEPQKSPRRLPGDLPGQHNIKLTSNSQQTHIKLTANSQQTHIKLTSNSHRPHIKHTSNSHQAHIDLTSNSHRPHIEHTENQTYIHIFYRECNSR